MTEDFDNHRRIIDGGDNLQGTAAVGAVFYVDVEVDRPKKQGGAYGSNNSSNNGRQW